MKGRQRAALEKLCGGDQRIHLAGFHGDVQSALQEFDLFVSPSREETFGLAILEAMSAGLPVLASAAEGPRELLRNQPAQLVAPGSLHDLSAGLALEFAKRRDACATVDKTRLAYDLSAFDPARSHGSDRRFLRACAEPGQPPRAPACAPQPNAANAGLEAHLSVAFSFMFKRPKSDLWQVGIVPSRLDLLLEPGALADTQDRITWLPDAGPWRYLADPFGLRRGDATHVFVEAFDYRDKHAVIEHHEFGPDLQWRGKSTVLAKPFHLSYPFVIEALGRCVHGAGKPPGQRDRALSRAAFPR